MLFSLRPPSVNMLTSIMFANTKDYKSQGNWQGSENCTPSVYVLPRFFLKLIKTLDVILVPCFPFYCMQMRGVRQTCCCHYVTIKTQEPSMGHAAHKRPLGMKAAQPGRVSKCWQLTRRVCAQETDNKMLQSVIHNLDCRFVKAWHFSFTAQGTNATKVQSNFSIHL